MSKLLRRLVNRRTRRANAAPVRYRAGTEEVELNATASPVRTPTTGEVETSFTTPAPAPPAASTRTARHASFQGRNSAPSRSVSERTALPIQTPDASRGRTPWNDEIYRHSPRDPATGARTYRPDPQQLKTSGKILKEKEGRDGNLSDTFNTLMMLGMMTGGGSLGGGGGGSSDPGGAPELAPAAPPEPNRPSPPPSGDDGE